MCVYMCACVPNFTRERRRITLYDADLPFARFYRFGGNTIGGKIVVPETMTKLKKIRDLHFSEIIKNKTIRGSEIVQFSFR